jgi:MFS family permease
MHDAPAPLTRRGLPLDPQLRVLALGSFATRFGGGAVMTTSAIYFTRHLGFTPGETALAISVAAAAGLLVALPAGHLGDTRGPREVLAWLMLGLAVATPLPVLARTPLSLAALLAIETALGSASNAVRNGVIAQLAIGGRGVQFKAYLRAVTNSAIALGSVFGGAALVLDTSAAFVSVFVLAGLLCGFAAWNSTRLRHLPPYHRAAGEPRLAVLRDVPYVMVSLTTAMFSLHFVAAELGLALFISQRTEVPRVMVAVLLLVNTVMVALLQVRLSRSADSVTTGARSLIRGGLLIAAGFALIGLADGAPPTIGVAVLVAGALVHVVGEMIGSGGQWGLQMGLAPHERQGQYQGFSSLGFGLINIIGPPLVTLLCVHGGRLGWIAMGGVVLAASMVAQPLSRWALANRASYGVTTHSG